MQTASAQRAKQAKDNERSEASVFKKHLTHNYTVRVQKHKNALKNSLYCTETAKKTCPTSIFVAGHVGQKN